jgi:hypothetical protein
MFTFAGIVGRYRESCEHKYNQLMQERKDTTRDLQAGREGQLVNEFGLERKEVCLG